MVYTEREVRPEIRRFTDEQRLKLESQGYVLELLDGFTITSHRNSGKNIKIDHFPNIHPELENSIVSIPSIRSEVALNPAQLLLEKSNGKTQEEIGQMILDLNNKIQNNISGVNVILGTIGDYMDLAFSPNMGKHFSKLEYEGNFVTTSTQIGESFVDFICVEKYKGVEVSLSHGKNRFNNIYAAPLIVPSEK